MSLLPCHDLRAQEIVRIPPAPRPEAFCGLLAFTDDRVFLSTFPRDFTHPTMRHTITAVDRARGTSRELIAIDFDSPRDGAADWFVCMSLASNVGLTRR